MTKGRTNLIDLVIFDCDGVLVDSEPIISEAHAATMRACGYDVTAQQLLDRFTGVPEPVVLATLQQETGIAFPADYSRRVSERVERETALGLKASPGAGEMLAKLQLPRCVASSGPLERVRRSLTITGLIPFFEPHLFSGSMVARGKPFPDLFLHAARTMGVEPERCLVVEDSLAGVQAGVAAGMRVIGFYGGGHCLPGHGAALRAEGATAAIANLIELLPLLD